MPTERVGPRPASGGAAGQRRMPPYGFAGSVDGQRDHQRSLRRIANRAQQVDRRRQRELRGPEAADEEATPDASAVFHRAQHVVDGRVAAGDGLDRHRLARQDAVTREQLTRDGRRPLGAGRTSLHAIRDERPSPERGPWHLAPRPEGRASGARRPVVRPDERAQRMQRVVRDDATPDEIPERADGFLREAAADAREKCREERCPRGAEMRRRCRCSRSLIDSAPRVRRTQQAQVIGQVEREASIPLAERLDAEPHDLAGRERADRGRRARSLRRAPAESRVRAPRPAGECPGAARRRRAARRVRRDAARCPATTPRIARARPRPRARPVAEAAPAIAAAAWPARRDRTTRAPFRRDGTRPERRGRRRGVAPARRRRHRRPDRIAPRTSPVVNGPCVRAYRCTRSRQRIGDRFEQRLRKPEWKRTCRGRRDNERRPRPR